jgi:hypothetical protein
MGCNGRTKESGLPGYARLAMSLTGIRHSSKLEATERPDTTHPDIPAPRLEALRWLLI